MGDLLSQAEIDALLSSSSYADDSPSSSQDGDLLSPQEIDALGEIGNISMGTASTTLFTLLGQKVLITAPKVEITTWGDLISGDIDSSVVVRTEFTHGLVGSNLLILRQEDTKIITDLMMGGDGTNTAGEITDLHLSAISEAMNQMMGSSATSLASIINKRIEMSTPKAYTFNSSPGELDDFKKDEKIVKISFKMEIGDLINSEIMQLLQIDFAKEMVEGLLTVEDNSNISSPIPEPNMVQQNIPQSSGVSQAAATTQYAPPSPQPQINIQSQSFFAPEPMPQSPMYSEPAPRIQQGSNQVRTSNFSQQQGPVNIQPVQYQSFDEGRGSSQKENIGLLMDVPLQVTVELGRTQKLIRDILEFAPGSIIELDKLAGEQVDILVNGKIIAKGEVVIIDESFGVRVTDIVQPSKRI